MNNRKCLYSGCLTAPWPIVIDRLYTEMGIEPVYIIGEDPGIGIVPQTHRHCYVHSLLEAWNGLGFPELDYRYALDDTLVRSIADEQLLALGMMDRVDLTRNGFPFVNRQHYFYFLLKRWLVILKEYNIDIVISPAVPHRVFDYVLYVAAKVLGIRFVMFQMTSFGDASFIIDDIDRTTRQMKQSIKNSTVPGELREDIRQRIAVVKGTYQGAIPDYMLTQQQALHENASLEKYRFYLKKVLKKPSKLLTLFQESSHRYTARNAMPFEKKEKRYITLMDLYKNRTYVRRLKKEYNSLVEESFLSKQYVLVALHYQPEETSNPTGGVFTDQELIVEMLHAFLNDTIRIVIKEHKTQFLPEGEGALGRSEHFYKNLASISERVRFVDSEADPFGLIDGALATVTISGTIGWESVIRGTPAFVFGRAWYEDMPGVYKIRTQMDLDKAWRNAVEGNEHISMEEIFEYHAKLQPFLIEGPHNMAFEGKADRSTDESAANIFEGIKRYLTCELQSKKIPTKEDEK